MSSRLEFLTHVVAAGSTLAFAATSSGAIEASSPASKPLRLLILGGDRKHRSLPRARDGRTRSPRVGLQSRT